MLDDPDILAAFAAHPYWRVNPAAQRALRLRLFRLLHQRGHRPLTCAAIVHDLVQWHPTFWF